MFEEIKLTTEETARWIKFHENVYKEGKSKIELMQAAQYFIDNFMAPYIKIIEGLL